ncbi:MAG TPA: 50S ribosomal protein L20 [Candidatus Paceibacterota bacterium]|nr:50S ribosomal protein L20 [Candidatus Paceibacterota bacterium]HOL54094.1 50S ribosomal protein L20 [Candidatus Paceibacterota bacterium]HON21813.1 50S ribosomal protein L20 [Candidatus Paceibacterota bacterium]HPP17126.1 50S ribosomal protein L20 [Candidatus Paceibacterota bacterium]HRU33749.1 50S ribosomal protein L20 [Candidatus Paceibacterota bacterium]
MARVKRGVTSHKKREKVLKQTKGFKWGRKSKERLAKEALLHAQSRSFVGRKQKKRNFRQLWETKIKAAALKEGLKYNEFIHLLKTNDIAINRKLLADLAETKPEVFRSLVAEVKK